MARQRGKTLNDLARVMVGDGKYPNLYFVTGKDGTFLVTSDFDLAYQAWFGLPRDEESSLEDRQYGVIASTEPEDDRPGAQLHTYDDSRVHGLRGYHRREVRVRGHRRSR